MIGFASLTTARWTSWVGMRYLRSKKSSGFLSLITVISVLGVALGVMAMIVVLSVMDGFEEELKKRLMRTDLHVLVTPKADTPGFERGVVPSGVFSPPSDPRIEAVHPVLSTELILRSARRVTGIVLKGIEEPRMEKLRAQITETAEAHQLKERQADGSELTHPGITIGNELAYSMGLIPGDFVTLISPTETEGTLANVPRLKRFVVEAIYKSGFPEQELHVVFTRATAVQSFLKRRDVVSQWEIVSRRFEDSAAIAKDLRREHSGLRVQDWMELNGSLFASLKLERVAMFVILAFIVVVASFNIVTTLTLMVAEKKREISILKAMGATRDEVAAIFLSEGVLIGVFGVSLGMALAYGVCYVLKNFEVVALPDIYYDRTFPVAFEPMYYVGIGLSALLIVLVACVYPSRRAADLHPLQGIRA